MMIKPLKNELKQYFPIIGFYILAWAVNLLLISIVSFFHFRLDHRLIEIENWIFDYSWTMNLMSKVVSLIIFYKYFANISLRTTSSKIDLSFIGTVNHEILLFISMNNMLLPILLRPRYLENVMFSFYSSLMHVSIILISFGIDLFINKLLIGQGTRRFGKSFISSLILFVYYSLVFPFGQGINIIFLSLLLLMLVYFHYSDFSFINGIAFIAGVLVPLFCFIGIDPVWGAKFSFFKPFPHSNYFLYFIVLSIITNLYFYFKRRRTL